MRWRTGGVGGDGGGVKRGSGDRSGGERGGLWDRSGGAEGGLWDRSGGAKGQVVFGTGRVVRGRVVFGTGREVRSEGGLWDRSGEGGLWDRSGGVEGRGLFGDRSGRRRWAWSRGGIRRGRGGRWGVAGAWRAWRSVGEGGLEGLAGGDVGGCGGRGGCGGGRGGRTARSAGRWPRGGRRGGAAVAVGVWRISRSKGPRLTRRRSVMARAVWGARRRPATRRPLVPPRSRRRAPCSSASRTAWWAETKGSASWSSQVGSRPMRMTGAVKRWSWVTPLRRSWTRIWRRWGAWVRLAGVRGMAEMGRGSVRGGDGRRAARGRGRGLLAEAGHGGRDRCVELEDGARGRGARG
jgi:hypothetical protein